MAARRISPGVYEINGKTFKGMASGAAAQAAYDKKYGNAAAKPPPAAAPGAAPAPPPVNNAQISQQQNQIASQAGNTALSNLQASSAPTAAPTGIDPVTGQGYDQTIAQTSNLGQAFNPQLTNRTTTGDLAADRARIEADVFSRLTTGLEQDYMNTRKQNEQTLRNKGIPFSADPNSRYQQELGALDRRYDDARLAAKQTATGIGGTEYQRDFDINEGLRQNQFNEQAGVRNQRIGESSGISQIGVPGALSYAQLAQQKALAQLQAKNNLQIAKQRGGGGGGGYDPNQDSPFNTGL